MIQLHLPVAQVQHDNQRSKCNVHSSMSTCSTNSVQLQQAKASVQCTGCKSKVPIFTFNLNNQLSTGSAVASPDRGSATNLKEATTATNRRTTSRSVGLSKTGSVVVRPRSESRAALARWIGLVVSVNLGADPAATPWMWRKTDSAGSKRMDPAEQKHFGPRDSGHRSPCSGLLWRLDLCSGGAAVADNHW